MQAKCGKCGKLVNPAVRDADTGKGRCPTCEELVDLVPVPASKSSSGQFVVFGKNGAPDVSLFPVPFHVKIVKRELAEDDEIGIKTSNQIQKKKLRDITALKPLLELAEEFESKEKAIAHLEGQRLHLGVQIDSKEKDISYLKEQNSDLQIQINNAYLAVEKSKNYLRILGAMLVVVLVTCSVFIYQLCDTEKISPAPCAGDGGQQPPDKSSGSNDESEGDDLNDRLPKRRKPASFIKKKGTENLAPNQMGEEDGGTSAPVQDELSNSGSPASSQETWENADPLWIGPKDEGLSMPGQEGKKDAGTSKPDQEDAGPVAPSQGKVEPPAPAQQGKEDAGTLAPAQGGSKDAVPPASAQERKVDAGPAAPSQEKVEPPAPAQQGKEDAGTLAPAQRGSKDAAPPAPAQEEKEDADTPAPAQERKEDVAPAAPAQEGKEDADTPAPAQERKKDAAPPAPAQERKEDAGPAALSQEIVKLPAPVQEGK